ncbi:MAG: Omp28-related outer membrane protein [Chlorobi bacterium]|nr:Omp28-related outer membrane protein [Chlorobiota bacterium]
MKKKWFFIGILLLFVGCNKEERGIDPESLSFTIYSPYGTHYITRYEIPFYARDAGGNDITANVTFYVNGQAVEGNVHVFDSPGDYVITAKWDLGGGYEKEAADSIRASVIDPRHPTYVIIEDFTGTWCVNCPRVHYKLEQLTAREPRVFSLAIHNRGNQTDPFHFEGVEELASVYGITGYPTPLINRNEIWNEEESHARQYLDSVRPAGLRIASSYDGALLDLTVKVRFDMDLTREGYKLVVYASENGLLADQANATDYYGGQNPIPDFEHNHVLRHAFTALLGDPIPSEQCVFDNEYTWHYSGPMPPEVSDPAQAEFTAMLVKGEEKPRVVNVKQAPVNTRTDY